MPPFIECAEANREVSDGENDCWNMALKFSGCGDDANSNPDVCLCRSAGIEEVSDINLKL
jgi:hypothetical protein